MEAKSLGIRTGCGKDAEFMYSVIQQQLLNALYALDVVLSPASSLMKSEDKCPLDVIILSKKNTDMETSAIILAGGLDVAGHQCNTRQVPCS